MQPVAWVLYRLSYPGTPSVATLFATIDMGADNGLMSASDVLARRDEGSRFLRNVGNQ